MKVAQRCLVLCVFGCMAVASAAQTPVGALAVDEGQGDQYGWAVDYETAATARARALGECGSGCSVVLTFERCAAYAADQAANSTALGWAESYGSAAEARGAALSECGSRGGSGCIVRVWGCNGPVVEEGLGLDRSARREIQQGLQGQGFDPGGADGMFGPRTRAAIRNWQTSQGARATGYLDGTSVAGLRSSVAGQTTFRQREQPAAGASARPSATAVAAARPSASGAPPAAQQGTAEQENLFWQSIVNSTDPADFEAYLEEFPNGVFRRLAQNRLAALRAPANDRPASVGPSVWWRGFAGYRVSGIRGWRRGVRGRYRRRRAASGWRRFPGLCGVPGNGGAGWRRSGAGALRGDGGGVSSVRVGDWRRCGRRMYRRRLVAEPRLSADGSSSCGVRELGRCAGVCVVAEPSDGRDISVADGGGVGGCVGWVTRRRRLWWSKP